MQEEIVTSENTEADLGTIYEEEGLARTVLVVRNNSADTLFPVAAYSHCRCAAATVSPLPVAPGGLTSHSIIPALRLWLTVRR